MAKITFLGTGAMGSRMAEQLIKGNHDVCVWNRNNTRTSALLAAGAHSAKTPAAAVKNADIVISMLRDDKASQSVWLDNDHGALANMNADSIAIDCSTLSIDWTKKLHNECAKQHIAFLEAPVAGSRPQAEAAQLVFFVGGEKATYHSALPILEVMGSAIHYVGDSGSAAMLKIAVNSLFATQAASIAELIALFSNSDVPVKPAIDILCSLPVCSAAGKHLANAMLMQKFTPMFPIELVEKDLSYAIQQLQKLPSTSPVTRATHQTFQEAAKAGYAQDNINAVIKLHVE